MRVVVVATPLLCVRATFPSLYCVPKNKPRQNAHLAAGLLACVGVCVWSPPPQQNTGCTHIARSKEIKQPAHVSVCLTVQMDTLFCRLSFSSFHVSFGLLSFCGACCCIFQVFWSNMRTRAGPNFASLNKP
ncbi:MAG: hypothetical protein BYD32DRAFT_427994 [Podila humilis]|nr:MAG: hypothetical protein BYD32DRAFT_427994 [Podila humilis]